MLIVSVAVSGVATKVTRRSWMRSGSAPVAEPLARGCSPSCLGLAANALLFFAFFQLLAAPDVPSRSLWSGALLGAVAFELLKQLSTFLLKATRELRAVQAFGIALILVVWINYFSRVVVYAAAWAHTSPEARAAREARMVAEQTVEGPRIDLAAAADVVRAAGASASPASSPKAAFAAGAASMLGLVALLRRRAAERSLAARSPPERCVSACSARWRACLAHRTGASTRRARAVREQVPGVGNLPHAPLGMRELAADASTGGPDGRSPQVPACRWRGGARPWRSSRRCSRSRRLP